MIGEKYESVFKAPEFIDITNLVQKYIGKKILNDIKIYALKFNFKNQSIKDVPASNIIFNVKSKLRPGTVIFEASSGNFGIALAKFGKEFGYRTVTLISREVNKNVLNALQKNGANVIMLNSEICPIPGKEQLVKDSQAKESFRLIRQKLVEIGLDPKIFEDNSDKIIDLLKKENTIELAKFLATIYNGFCPMQYENELNPLAHYGFTAKLIDDGLKKEQVDLSSTTIVCTFGTGGTSFGISKYFREKYNNKIVTVAFPEEGQNVGGIRTLKNAGFLPFFKPELYKRIVTVNFSKARDLIKFFYENDESIGESTALAIQAALDLIESGAHEKTYVIIFADDFEKYSNQDLSISLEITLTEAKRYTFDYVVWVLPIKLSRMGMNYLSQKIGIDPEKIITEEEFLKLNPRQGTFLFVCTLGKTSLEKVKSIKNELKENVKLYSLKGGIFHLIENDKSINIEDILDL